MISSGRSRIGRRAALPRRTLAGCVLSGSLAALAAGATSEGLTSTRAPSPFSIRFPDARPPAKAAIKRPERPVHPVVKVPGIAEPKQYVLNYRYGGRWIETATAEPLVPDLRFSESVVLEVEAERPGDVELVALGVFRYSDRTPRWQPQWDDVLKLRERLVPNERRPMAIDVFVDERPAGRLAPAKTELKEVELEAFVSSPKKAVEEVVTRLAGRVAIPAGRHHVRLVHTDIVDGFLARIGLGIEP